MGFQYDPNDPWLEIVNGAIIGELRGKPYQFWTRDGNRRIAMDWFRDDVEAEQWFKEKFPSEYKAGVEMRVYDLSPAGARGVDTETDRV